MNNADFGLTLQSLICSKYNLPVNRNAAEQFKANFNESYIKELTPICKKIFGLLGCGPIELLTYSSRFVSGSQRTSPHNFLLENGRTLSIRTMKSSEKVSPHTLGQAGYPILNDFFGDVLGRKISTQSDIRDLVYNHIHEILPAFIDHFFVSDYTVFIYRNDLNKIELFHSDELGRYEFSRDDFTFTRDLSEWKESTTLKYQGISIAEIQTHQNRTFKFRFIVPTIPLWVQTVRETTETLGITAEAAICDFFSIDKPAHFATRVSHKIERQLMPVVEMAFKNLPAAVTHTGSLGGNRGKNSKCAYDFVLEGEKTLSLKTNKGKKVCPPDVGQPGRETLLLFFGGYLPEGLTDVTSSDFKQMVFQHIADIMPIYVEHLFESDYLLWIYTQREGKYSFDIVRREEIRHSKWDSTKFSFSKPTIADWNESNTVKYDGVSIGEFQVHRHRVCYKFRFNMPALLSLVRKGASL